MTVIQKETRAANVMRVIEIFCACGAIVSALFLFGG